jgi:hypothetical protein
VTPFQKYTLLAIGVQTILALLTALLIFLFDLSPESSIARWLQLYVPTIFLMIAIMMALNVLNLFVAIVLGFMIGASFYGAFFGLLVHAYRQNQAFKKAGAKENNEE